MMALRWVVPLLLIILLVQKAKSGTNGQDSSGVQQVPETVSLLYPVKEINKTQLQELIQQRDGKILLLNIWATWCLPCREEFPDFNKISRFYKEKPLEVVGISVDYPDEIESKINPFLEKQHPQFQNYVQNFSDDSELIRMLHPDWNGGIPATFIFDKEGNLKKFLIGKQSFHALKEMIDELLPE
ncbi:MAG: hypothetical protein Kow0042_15590 [Calditrichia bacterium]